MVIFSKMITSYFTTPNFILVLKRFLISEKSLSTYLSYYLLLANYYPTNLILPSYFSLINVTTVVIMRSVRCQIYLLRFSVHSSFPFCKTPDFFRDLGLEYLKEIVGDLLNASSQSQVQHIDIELQTRSVTLTGNPRAHLTEISDNYDGRQSITMLQVKRDFCLQGHLSASV